MGRGSMNQDGSTVGPLYHEIDPWKKLLLRGWFVITFLAVVVAFILGLLKAKDDAVLYLLVVNLLVSGVVGMTIAWWFHKGHIAARSLVFILFVGVCIVFQAIVSDIYLYHSPKSSGSSSPHQPTNSSTISPTMSSTYTVMAQVTETN